MTRPSVYGIPDVLSPHHISNMRLTAGQDIRLHRLHHCGKVGREYTGHQPSAFTRCHSGACSAYCAGARLHTHGVSLLAMVHDKANRAPLHQTGCIAIAFKYQYWHCSAMFVSWSAPHQSTQSREQCVLKFLPRPFPLLRHATGVTS